MSAEGWPVHPETGRTADDERQPQEIVVEHVQGFGRAYLTFAYTVTPAAS